VDAKVFDPNDAATWIINNAGKFAAAKANRVYLEEFRKSKKAMLMAECVEKAVNAREQYAYAHAEYLEVLDGIKAAIEAEETLKWHMVAAEARIEIWRTQCANNRNQDRVMR
jgi:hypothetical protein